MFVLVREDKSLMQSYHYKTQFKYRKVAERNAADLEQKKGYGKITVMSMDEYRAAGYDKLTRMVVNYMTKELVEESINTTYECSVASEHYHCS